MKLLCRLGFHTSTYLDCASLYIYAQRCNHCGNWIDEYAGANVEAYRKEKTQ